MKVFLMKQMLSSRSTLHVKLLIVPIPFLLSTTSRTQESLCVHYHSCSRCITFSIPLDGIVVLIHGRLKILFKLQTRRLDFAFYFCKRIHGIFDVTVVDRSLTTRYHCKGNTKKKTHNSAFGKQQKNVRSHCTHWRLLSSKRLSAERSNLQTWFWYRPLFVSWGEQYHLCPAVRESWCQKASRIHKSERAQEIEPAMLESCVQKDAALE